MTLPTDAPDAQPNALEKAPATQSAELAPVAPPKPRKLAPRVKLKPVPPGSRTLAVVVDEGLADAVLATGAGPDAPHLALHWLTQAASAGSVDTRKLSGPELQAAVEHQSDLVLASVHGIGPKDAVEGMLATQMTALHDLAMVAMSAAATAERADTLERAVRNATKLQGAFLATLDGLKRWRGGTTVQRVVVERVDVHAGGQAVVGAVSNTPRGDT